MNFPNIDWIEVFKPDVPLLEMMVRGTVIYFAVFFILRSSLRRTAGELAMLDFVFVLLVANGAADAMTGGSISLSGAIVLVATVVALNYMMNSLSFHFRIVERLLAPPPLQVIRDGKPIRSNMRKEFLSLQELEGQLREEGVEDITTVKAAYIEGDGQISVITNDA